MSQCWKESLHSWVSLINDLVELFSLLLIKFIVWGFHDWCARHFNAPQILTRLLFARYSHSNSWSGQVDSLIWVRRRKVNLLATCFQADSAVVETITLRVELDRKPESFFDLNRFTLTIWCSCWHWVRRLKYLCLKRIFSHHVLETQLVHIVANLLFVCAWTLPFFDKKLLDFTENGQKFIDKRMN